MARQGTTRNAYQIVLTKMEIKNPKKWLLENTDGARKIQGTGIKPIEVMVDGKPQYYMSYAEACYRMIKGE